MGEGERGVGRRRQGGRLPMPALVATVVALFVAAGAGALGSAGLDREESGRDGGGRVAILAVEGLGPGDLETLGLADRVGRITGEPSLAYGIVRRAPPGGSQAAWRETTTGLFAATERGSRGVEGKAVWERAEAAGRRAAVFPVPVPETPPLGERQADESQAAADEERMAEARASWRAGGNDLVVAGVGCVATERFSEGRRDLNGACRRLVDSLVRDWVLAPGEGGTVLVVSSASTAPGPDASEVPGVRGEGPVYLGPGTIIASGRGVGGRRWPAIARLADVTPTALHMLGVALPSDMNGIVLWDVLDPAFLFHEPIRYARGPVQ